MNFIIVLYSIMQMKIFQDISEIGNEIRKGKKLMISHNKVYDVSMFNHPGISYKIIIF